MGNLTVGLLTAAALLIVDGTTNAQPSASPSSTNSINGALLSGDIQQQAAVRARNEAAFLNVLRGFPRDAFELHVENISHLPDDAAILNVQYQLGLKADWLTGFKSRLAQLAVASFKVSDRDTMIGAGDTDLRMFELIATGRVGNQFGARFCIYSAQGSECYLLPDGNYGQTLGLQLSGLHNLTPPPAVTLRMFAADGTPTSPCLVRILGARPNIQDNAHGNLATLGGRTGGQVHTRLHGQDIDAYIGKYYDLHVDPAEGAFLLNSNEADLAKSTRMDFASFFVELRYPGQPPFISNGMLGKPNAFIATDIAEKPSQTDACKSR